MNDPPAGLSFPLRVGADGRLCTSTGVPKIEENIAHLLLTRVGERPIRRDVGGGLHELLQEPDDEVLRALLRHQIAVTIDRWEPRVQLTSLTVERHGEVLMVDLGYLERAGGGQHTLSVPLDLGSR